MVCVGRVGPHARQQQALLEATAHGRREGGGTSSSRLVRQTRSPPSRMLLALWGALNLDLGTEGKESHARNILYGRPDTPTQGDNQGAYEPVYRAHAGTATSR